MDQTAGKTSYRSTLHKNLFYSRIFHLSKCMYVCSHDLTSNKFPVICLTYKIHKEMNCQYVFFSSIFFHRFKIIDVFTNNAFQYYLTIQVHVNIRYLVFLIVK